MNRRTKERVDLHLQCRLGPSKVLSIPLAGQSQIIGLTQNLSRCGILMRWQDNVELPVVGSELTVDIDLPADAAYGRRLMRCRTTVVRILTSDDGVQTVGMKIRNIRFVSIESGLNGSSSRSGATRTDWELESMPTATERLN